LDVTKGVGFYQTLNLYFSLGFMTLLQEQ